MKKKVLGEKSCRKFAKFAGAQVPSSAANNFVKAAEPGDASSVGKLKACSWKSTALSAVCVATNPYVCFPPTQPLVNCRHTYMCMHTSKHKCQVNTNTMLGTNVSLTRRRR